jgi:hypothetical protein
MTEKWRQGSRGVGFLKMRVFYWERRGLEASAAG